MVKPFHVVKKPRLGTGDCATANCIAVAGVAVAGVEVSECSSKEKTSSVALARGFLLRAGTLGRRNRRLVCCI